MFPDNSGLDWDRYGQANFLYVSHLHQDHRDPALLNKHVSRDATVLLPDFPVDDLRDELERLGFTRFMVLPTGQVVEYGGLTTPARPTWTNCGPSGPTTYTCCSTPEPSGGHGPMSCPRPHSAGSARPNEPTAWTALRYVTAIGARQVVPFAGPACFLDEDLFGLNDLTRGWYAEQHRDEADIRLGDWIIQRRCPHLRGDLGRFGRTGGTTLTCTMHGWQFDLPTGDCLTAASGTHHLRSQPARSQAR